MQRMPRVSLEPLPHSFAPSGTLSLPNPRAGRCRLFCLAVALLAWSAGGLPADAPRVEPYLVEGRLGDGQRELTDYLREHPTDDEARFGLGALQFLRGIEHLAQSLHRFGALGPRSGIARRIPLIRMYVPPNPQPEQIAYAEVRRMLQQLKDELAAAEQTLAAVTSRSVKLPLHFGRIQLDLDHDGHASPDEALWKVYAELNRGLQLGQRVTPESADTFLIAFDYADLCWLRGYCHLLSAICEAILAYDEQSLFNVVAPHLFDRPPVPPIPPGILKEAKAGWDHEIADAIAAVHLARFPLIEADRMPRSLAHLEQVIALSRQSWAEIEQETDDDHEWIPNARQSSVIPGVGVTPPMIGGWREFLAQAEQVLQGKQHIPHWRLDDGYGINLRRVFTEPHDFDLVLWAHGSAAVPYAERGPVATPETWNRLQELFGGQFIGFAFWFN